MTNEWKIRIYLLFYKDYSSWHIPHVTDRFHCSSKLCLLFFSAFEIDVTTKKCIPFLSPHLLFRHALLSFFPLTRPICDPILTPISIYTFLCKHQSMFERPVETRPFISHPITQLIDPLCEESSIKKWIFAGSSLYIVPLLHVGVSGSIMSLRWWSHVKVICTLSDGHKARARALVSIETWREFETW